MMTSRRLLCFATISRYYVLFLVVFSIFFSAKLMAREARINWIPPITPPDGYTLYYKTGTSGQPYNGTGANEGDSPIDLGDRTTFTLSGLSKTETYYLCIASYIASDQSGCSKEIVLPPSLPPESGRNIHFVWPEKIGTDEYRLYYKTGESGPPYDGTGANEGSSPVISTDTNLILHGLASTETLFFTYTRVEGTEESDPSQEIELLPSNINNPPVANELSISTPEDTVYSGQLSASDANQDTLTYTITTPPSLGQLQMDDNTTGDFTYSPNNNAHGSDLFQFSVNDGTFDSSPAEVSITISAINDPPLTTPLTVSTPEDNSITIQLSATDPDGDQLTYRISSSSPRGTTTLTDENAGVVRYTPNANATGNDSFSFVANDGNVDSPETQVLISISPRNDPPSAEQLSFTLNEDITFNGQLQGNDPDGDSLTYSLSTSTTKGQITIINPSTGSFRYTPNQNYHGSDAFSYIVADAAIASAPATVNLTINTINDPPTVSDASFSTGRNRSLSATLSASDPDGDPLIFSVLTAASKGTIEITDRNNGYFSYTPSLNETGEDSFTFKVNDGTADSAGGNITISISATNTAPVASKVSISTLVNTPYTGNLPAYDSDGDQLQYTLTSTGSLGTASLTDPTTGKFLYTPDRDKTGEDSFNYTVSDGEITSKVGTVFLSIIPANMKVKILGSTDDADTPGTITETYLSTSNENHANEPTATLSTICTTAPCPIASTLLLRVDLGHLPSYTRVENAVLHLYQIGATGDVSFPTTLHPIDNIHSVISEANGYNASSAAAWTPVDEGSTFSDIPLGLANIGEAEDNTVLLPQNGYKSWNITRMVQKWITLAESNRGLLISGGVTEEQSQRIFGTSEHQNSEMRPYILIHYNLEPPVPELIIIEERE